MTQILDRQYAINVPELLNYIDIEKNASPLEFPHLKEDLTLSLQNLEFVLGVLKAMIHL